MNDRVTLVNLLQGTRSDHDFSTGNTLPLVARPWGLHHWSLQTGASPWTFDSRRKKLWGIRLTHQPSPWMRDYASLMLSPFHGLYYADPAEQASSYRQDQSELSPSSLETNLLRYGINIRMAPTERGAAFVFSTVGELPLKLRFDFDGPHSLDWDQGSCSIRGKSADCFEGEELKNFGLFWVGEFDVAPESLQVSQRGGYLVFPQGVRTVSLKLAGSFVSHDLARLSWERELKGKNIGEIADEGREIWNQLLGRIRIEARSQKQLEIFYSCLYRCLLFPRFLDEIDGEGKVVHYSPYDGQVHEGSLCADSGFWDTYRTLYPLLALVYPDVVTRMAQGWLNACRESEWSPKWASPGPRDCMIGTHFNVFVADLVAKGLVNWEVEEAFGYLWKDTVKAGVCGRFGRRGLVEYNQLGYIPVGGGPNPVASTLDYAYDDFCVGVVATHLGRKEEAETLRLRSQNYRNLFDDSTGFMRARTADGKWEEPFQEFAWGGSYIEGGPWQHRFNVPHDVEGLIGLMGGKEAFCRQLDLMLETPPHFEAGTYPFEIHEMSEMAAVDFGQYAHSNQPVHNYLFLYGLAGEQEKMEHWVGKVLDELYTPDSFPGDEDNGEMAAWYVWATLGLFPVCPGKAEYLRFNPFVTAAEIFIAGESNPLVIGKGKCPGGLVGHRELLYGEKAPELTSA